MESTKFSRSRLINFSSRLLPRRTGTIAVLRSIANNRLLVAELARRELTDLHAGQLGGRLWLLAHPLIVFAVYAVLFTVIFQVRVEGRGPSDYLVYLFSGLAPWLLTQDALVRSANSLISNSSIVKKVMFPTEILVARSLISSITIQGSLFAAAFVYMIFVKGLSISLLLLPVLLLLHLALLWGLALLLSIFTPYFRDIPEILRVFLTINIYLMPVTFLPSMVPSALRFVLFINPFSHLIWCYQDVLYFNTIAHPMSWIVLLVLSATMMAAGSYAFVRLRRHLSSVL